MTLDLDRRGFMKALGAVAIVPLVPLVPLVPTGGIVPTYFYSSTCIVPLGNTRCKYVVFDDLPLAEFANRIPRISVSVICP